MNPDKLRKHELERVQSMTDDQLSTRYGKMTKEDKIEGFYKVLTEEGRAKKLQKQIASDMGYDSSKKNVGPWNDVEKKKAPMKFVKVLSNENKSKQAVFVNPENAQYYLYSYINNDMTHETMVFYCDSDGDCDDMNELAYANGYKPSSEIMSELV
tara:strand:+ start:1802 stop:2266 length:465 start_codon:yes stop_codon:yes gene_type:complete